MKRTILAVSAFAASLMVSAVAVSAPVQAEEIFHSRKAVAEAVATTPLYEAQYDTQTTTTTTDLSGGNNVETTTTLDSAATGSEETTTTTTTVPLQVVTVNATLHASFNGDKEDAPSVPLSISSNRYVILFLINVILGVGLCLFGFCPAGCKAVHSDILPELYTSSHKGFHRCRPLDGCSVYDGCKCSQLYLYRCNWQPVCAGRFV